MTALSAGSLVERPDSTEPVTLEQVVAAVLALDRFSEEEVLDLISHGKLREVFAFGLRTRQLPPDTVPWDNIREAPARPLTEEEDLASVRGEPSPKDGEC